MDSYNYSWITEVIDRPNQVIAYPTGLIPMFLITLALCFHVLSIAEARRARREAAGSASIAGGVA